MSDSDFRQKLRMAAGRRSPLRNSGHTNAYRIFHSDADGIPGVTVDWFDGVAVVSLYAAWGEKAERDLIEALAAELAPRSVYLKRRPREACRLTQAEAKALAPEAPAWGESVAEQTILENGLRFRIRPPHGLAVGLYLDMRDTRRWVQEQGRSRRVLNCFAYTCAFAVCARAGGAEQAVNVDLSRGALDWGKQNAQLNGYGVARGDYLCGDVFDWLRRFRKRGQRFDLVVLDPPSFATSRLSRFTASADWPRLVGEACAVVDRAGWVLVCCNQASLSADRWEGMVRRGFQGASRRATLVRRLRASGVDFPSLPGKEDALKVLAYQLDEPAEPRLRKDLMRQAVSGGSSTGRTQR